MASIVLRNATVDIPIFDNTSRSLKKAALGYSIGGVLGVERTKPSSFARFLTSALILRAGIGSASSATTVPAKSTLLRVLAGIYEPTGRHLRSPAKLRRCSIWE